MRVPSFSYSISLRLVSSSRDASERTSSLSKEVLAIIFLSSFVGRKETASGSWRRAPHYSPGCLTRKSPLWPLVTHRNDGGRSPADECWTGEPRPPASARP